MRITRAALLLACVLLGAGEGVAGAQMPKYGVTVKVSKPEPLAKARTYSWAVSQPSPIKTVDAAIIAAIERQLTALGLTVANTGKSDLVATYAAVRRSDVDLKAKAADGERPQYPVGTLVVDLRDAAGKQPLFRVRIDTPISLDQDKLDEQLDAALTAMFAKYPGRTAKS